MNVPKIAVTLPLVGALSLACHGSAQSAPLISLSAAANPSAQFDVIQARCGGWGSPYDCSGYYPDAGYGYPYRPSYPYATGYPAYGYGYYHPDGSYHPYAGYGYDATRYPAYGQIYHRPYWRRYGYGLDRPYYRRWY